MRTIVAARLSRKQANGQQGIGIDTQDELSRGWAEREGTPCRLTAWADLGGAG